MDIQLQNKSIPSYPKVFNVGHIRIKELFDDPVLVQEKVDGSQISFGVIDGKVCIRSKNAIVQLGDTSSLFAKGAEQIENVAHKLVPGYAYRGEYLRQPKHNSLTYNRIPNQHIVLFDIENLDNSAFLSPEMVREEAEKLGFEYIPVVAENFEVKKMEDVMDLMNRESFLGGAQIEGLVFKNYNRWTLDGKTMMGKYVSEQFKEKHEKEWGKSNPKKTDSIAVVVEALATEPRWQKAVQHMREDGTLQGAPQDIGPLIARVKEDVKEEEADFIKEQLFKAFWPQIERGITRGLPQWYKDQLLESQFE